MATRSARMTDKREFLTATIAPHTRARIDAFCKATGLSRGRLLDLAVDSLDICEACQGRGLVDGHRCLECGALGVIQRA